MTNFSPRTRLFSSLTPKEGETTSRNRQTSGSQFLRGVDRALNNLNGFSKRFETITEELLQRIQAENRQDAHLRSSLSNIALGSSQNPSIASFKSGSSFRNPYEEAIQSGEPSMSARVSPKAAPEDTFQNVTNVSIDLGEESLSESFEMIFPSQKRLKVVETFIDDEEEGEENNFCDKSGLFSDISPINSENEETFSEDCSFFENDKFGLNKEDKDEDFLNESVCEKNVTSDTIEKAISYINSTIVRDNTEKSKIKMTNKHEDGELSTEFSIEFEITPEIKKSESVILRENERILSELDNEEEIILTQN